MEINLATQISRRYKGNLVYSSSRKVARVFVDVSRLNHILVKVSFELNGQKYTFRGMLSEQEEGQLMIIQDRVTEQYILTGVSGFVYMKPNIHGGYINKLGAFYFHINVKDFQNEESEIYFMGKETEAFDQLEQERAQAFLKANPL